MSEGSSETSDGRGTSSSELGAHLVENYRKQNRLATIKLFKHLASLPENHFDVNIFVCPRPGEPFAKF